MKNIWKGRIGVVGLLMAMVGLGTHAPEARAGNVYILDCPNCLTVNDFKVLAGTTAAQRMMGGVYVIVGVNNAVTGHIRVTGQIATTCTPDGECRAYYKIGTITSITSGGAAANTQADLYRNDTELFGTTRVEKIPPIEIDPDRASSIVNNDMNVVVGAIGHALGQMNINPATIPTNTVIKVKFADGTSATFMKLGGFGSVQWQWTGEAWDKDGNRINLDGSAYGSNPNTAGGSGGSVGMSFPGRAGGTIIYSMSTSSKCLIKVTVTWNGRTGTWYGWTNCN